MTLIPLPLPTDAGVPGGWHDGGMSLTTLETALVGRERERETLREAFARAQGAEPAAVVLSGEAGIGKSRLVRDAQESFRAEADVHVGWCLDLGAGRTPYGALTAVLRSLVATLGVVFSSARRRRACTSRRSSASSGWPRAPRPRCARPADDRRRTAASEQRSVGSQT